MPTKEPQNIYDNPVFFDSFIKLRENKQGFNHLIEQPAIRSVLPELKSKDILDLGCGYGDFCRYAAEKGARSVQGIDISKKMIQLAQSRNQSDVIKYNCQAIEDFSIPTNSIDLVISSLALHYIADYPAIVKKIYECLRLNGHLIFSVEHPVCTATPACRTIEDNGKTCFPVENYRDEGQFQQTWLVDNVIKYHRTIQTYVNTVIEAGFVLRKLLEPMPTDEAIQAQPNLAVHTIRPPLLVLCALKK